MTTQNMWEESFTMFYQYVSILAAGVSYWLPQFGKENTLFKCLMNYVQDG